MKLTRVQVKDLRSTNGGKSIAVGGWGIIYPVTPKRQLATDIILNGAYLLKAPRVTPQAADSTAFETHLDEITRRIKFESTYFESRMAVPRAIAERDSRFVGFLMREFSEGCYFTKKYSDGEEVNSLLQLKEFLNKDSERNKVNVPKLKTIDRVEMIADMFTTLAKLHEHGLIVGDISGSNLVLQKKASRTGNLRVLFLDVDSFWHLGAPHPHGPSSTLHWRSPEEIKNPQLGPTKQSDVYKAALMARRLLHQEANTGTSSFDIYSSRVANETLTLLGSPSLTERISKALNVRANIRPKAMELAFEFKTLSEQLREQVLK